MTGLTLGIIGLALTTLLCGIGSGLGLHATAKASAGVLAEDPKKFGKVIILTLLPATQGLYGFAIAFIGAAALPTVANLQNAGMLGVASQAQIMAQGWNVFWACLPMMIGGAVSAFLQGRAAAATIIAVGKNSETSKAFLFPAMIEFYALLGLVVSIILFNHFPVDQISNITIDPVKDAATALVTAFVG
ncbi:MAG: V-type ATP synthase subunit K [Corallococcus sp.]|nr:V-type ATP synthase subunit K [Corallococcus sp.]MCM1359387.1 V-type ATP synthase subunit K [Corallococcus sp.]MCM1394830.1 V-type ATP synthase subunit K [Corallococcus sp.]